MNFILVQIGTLKKRNIMFEKFERTTFLAVVHAQQEARQLSDSYIGSEHLLLGLLDVEGVAAEALKTLGVTRAQVLEQLSQIPRRSAQASAGQSAFSTYAKATFQQATSEAAQLRSQTICTEHLLLALVRVAFHHKTTVGRELFRRLEVDPLKLRNTVYMLTAVKRRRDSLQLATEKV